MKILRKGSQSSKIIKIKPFVGLFGGSNKLIDVYNVKLNSIFFPNLNNRLDLFQNVKIIIRDHNLPMFGT